MQVRIEKIVAGADGLARLPDGRVVFIPGALPDELVEVDIVSGKKDFARARLTQIIQPSPYRGEPACPYYGICGGCDLQHASWDYQNTLKHGLLNEALERIGGMEPASIGLDMKSEATQMLGYRTRARFHVDPVRKAAGFLARGSNRVIPIETCPILAPQLQTLFERRRESWITGESGALKQGRKTHGKPKSLTVSATACDEGAVEGLEQGSVTLKPEGLPAKTFHFDAEVFFQSNLGMFERLLADIIPHCSGESAVDLYAGVGVFSAFLQDRFTRVTAVERDRFCVKHARKHLDTRSVTFCTQPAEQWITQQESESVDLLLVDPPRNGLAEEVTEALLSLRPEQIVYISCNPATFARDLKRICGGGLYTIKLLRGYDFNPQTSHIEAAAVLQRN